MVVFYAIKHKHLEDGHSKTDAYIDSQMRLDARLFPLKGFREEICEDASSLTSQFRSFRVS